jgi:hypothetical protein
MSRLEFPYDAAYKPPAPVVEIVVVGQGGARAHCKALVDPSASVSCIPRDVLDSIQAPRTVEVMIRTFLGETKVLPRRDVTIRLGSKEARLYVLPHEGQVALLGRDFLNDCVVVLDGKAQTVCVDN